MEVECTALQQIYLKLSIKIKTILPKKIKFNLQNETKYNSFLLENSSKTLFKKKTLDLIEPYTFIKNKEYILGNQIKFYIEKFVNSTPIFDIHTHLFPSKFKNFIMLV